MRAVGSTSVMDVTSCANRRPLGLGDGVADDVGRLAGRIKEGGARLRSLSLPTICNNGLHLFRHLQGAPPPLTAARSYKVRLFPTQIMYVPFRGGVVIMSR